MLLIKEDVLHYIKTTAISNRNEQGFVLGCSSSYACIDCVAVVPAQESGPYYYTPDHNHANGIIQNWADRKICFSGFIHSHTNGNSLFSENDMAFAEQLIFQYSTPFMWFGLAIVDANSVEIMFCKLSRRGSECVLEQVEYTETQ